MHCNVYQSLFLFSDALYHFCALFAVVRRLSVFILILMHQTGISVGSGCFEQSIAVYCTTIGSLVVLVSKTVVTLFFSYGACINALSHGFAGTRAVTGTDS